MRRYFEEMIGSQLVEIFKNSDGLAVGFKLKLSNGKTKHFDFIEDAGDCSAGWNIFSMIDFDSVPLNRHPVITDIEEHKISNDIYPENGLRVIFFSEDAIISEINCYSSSGDGLHYGATVSIKCRETNEETVLTAW